MTPAARLRERAWSYARDAERLRALGDDAWAAYVTIADELRKVADESDAAIARVRYIHRRDDDGHCAASCLDDNIEIAKYPCDTMRALDGDA